MDILKLYQDYNITHVQSGHKHCRPGWVQIECPFCTGNPGYHLGYCFDQSDKFANHFVCWRCGGKGVVKVLSTILNVSKGQAARIARNYGGRAIKKSKRTTVIEKPFFPIKLPPYTKPLYKNMRALKYLRERGFKPRSLVNQWDLMATNHLGSYKFRIIIPIYFRGVLVSYQGRDYSGKSSIKYKACRMKDESIHHKHILYGLDQVKGDKVVVVEGAFDVWKLGPGATATFGIKYTDEQVRQLAGFKEVFIMFDPQEKQATKQAEKLAIELSERKIISHVVDLEMPGKDPADLSYKRAKKIMDKLLK